MKFFLLALVFIGLAACSVEELESGDQCEDCGMDKLSAYEENQAKNILGSTGDVANYLEGLNQGPNNGTSSFASRMGLFTKSRRPLRQKLKESIPLANCLKDYQGQNNTDANFSLTVSGGFCPIQAGYSQVTTDFNSSSQSNNKLKVQYRKLFEAESQVKTDIAKLLVEESYEDSVQIVEGVYSRTSKSRLNANGQTTAGVRFSYVMNERKTAYEPLASLKRRYTHKRVDRLSFKRTAMVLVREYEVQAGALSKDHYRLNGAEITRNQYFEMLQDGEIQFGLNRHTSVPSSGESGESIESEVVLNN